MNGKASELYSWGPPKLKYELRLLQKKNNKKRFDKDAFVFFQLFMSRHRDVYALA